MYPLLISAASSVASSLLDRWQTSQAAKAAQAAAPKENFAALLEKNSAATPGPAMQMAALRQKLLGSPEVATLLAGADPAKPPVLTLGADGSLTAQGADGRATRVPLSPESAATARELAALGATSLQATAPGQRAG